MLEVKDKNLSARKMHENPSGAGARSRTGTGMGTLQIYGFEPFSKNL